MLKCVICANGQSKLKGNLSKECFHEKHNSGENRSVIYNTMSANTNDASLNDGTNDRAIDGYNKREYDTRRKNGMKK